MPNRWAITSGNWGNASTWSGSLIPTASDDVFANNFTVNVDTNFQVLSLNSTAITGVTAGGSFNFNSGSISGSITSATPLSAGATNLITVTAATGTVALSLGGGVTPRAITSDTLISHSGPCNLNLNGTNFSGGGATSAICINKTSIGNINIVGNVIGGPNNSANGLVSTGGNSIITGSVFGGTNNLSARGVDQSSGNLTVLGDVIGRNGSSVAITFAGTTLTVIGNILGGSTSTAISANITGTIIVTGSVSGSLFGTGVGLSSTSATTVRISGSISSGRASAISLTGTSTLIAEGPITSTINTPAVISSNASAINTFTGPFINAYNTTAVQCVRVFMASSAKTFWNYGNIILYSPEQVQTYPSSSNVRQGILYADGVSSGSLIIPSPLFVISGTPTDNTTGSAVLLPSQLQDDMWGRDLAQMTVTESIGYRLTKAATTDSIGKQISSYLV